MKCTFREGCENTPIAQYVWPWGENGLCCADCQVVLGQKSEQLKRQVQITPLAVGAPPPMERAERIELNAKILTLEAEVSEARDRGLDLYRQVERLQEQVILETSKCASVAASLERALVQIDELRAENGRLREVAATENDELQRLRALVPRPPETLEA